MCCRFLDIDSEEATALGVTTVAHTSSLPIVIVGGEIRYQGLFSPTFIQRDVGILLSGAKLEPVSKDDHQPIVYDHRFGGGWGFAKFTH